MAKEPEWLTEILEMAERQEELNRIEWSKVRADQALAALGVINEKSCEIEEIAQEEINLIQAWKEAELAKLQRKESWLSQQVEMYIRSTGESTINLPHGVIKIRKSRDKVEIVDVQKFLPIAQKLGLVRVIEAKVEPDLNALRAYLKINGNRPPSGVIVTPGTPSFSYTTTKKGSIHEQDEQSEAEDRRSIRREQATPVAA